MGVTPGEKRYIVNELGVGYRMLAEDEEWNLPESVQMARENIACSLGNKVTFYLACILVKAVWKKQELWWKPGFGA